jgi:hypothetical protein
MLMPRFRNGEMQNKIWFTPSIRNWISTLSLPQEPRSSVQLNPTHKLLLVVQKHELVILLYRPVITSGDNTSSFEAAMKNVSVFLKKNHHECLSTPLQ